MQAYVGMAGRPWSATAATCALAGLGDMAVTLLIYGAGALATGRTRWLTAFGYKAYAAAALAGATGAAVIDWMAQTTGQWAAARFSFSF